MYSHGALSSTWNGSTSSTWRANMEHIPSSPESTKDAEEDMDLDSPEYVSQHCSGRREFAASVRTSLQASNMGNLPAAVHGDDLWSTCPTTPYQSGYTEASTLWSDLDDFDSTSHSSLYNQAIVSTSNSHLWPKKTCSSVASFAEDEDSKHCLFGVDVLKITDSSNVCSTTVESSYQQYSSANNRPSRIHRSLSHTMHDHSANLLMVPYKPQSRLPSFHSSYQSQQLSSSVSRPHHRTESTPCFEGQSKMKGSVQRRSIASQSNESITSTFTEPACEDANHISSFASSEHQSADTSSDSQQLPNKRSPICRCTTTVIVIALSTLALAISMASIHQQGQCIAHIDTIAVRAELFRRVHGQHIAIKIVGDAVQDFVDSDRHIVVMSFHGWTGVGKNYVSGILADFFPANAVHKLIVPLHFPHGTDADAAALSEWIMSNVSEPACGIHLFIIDEVDKAAPSLLAGLRASLSKLSAAANRRSPDVARATAIIILLSNAGAGPINAHTGAVLSSGGQREAISYEDIRPNESAVVWLNEISADTLVDFVVPFLPLERRHVIECIRSTLQQRGLHVSETITTQILDSLSYFPADTQLFSKTGCRKVSYLIDLLL